MSANWLGKNSKKQLLGMCSLFAVGLLTFT